MTYQQSVFKSVGQYLSAITVTKHFFRVFTYKMAANINWHSLDVEQNYVTHLMYTDHDRPTVSRY